MIIILPTKTRRGSAALLLKKGSMNGQIYFLIIMGPLVRPIWKRDYSEVSSLMYRKVISKSLGTSHDEPLCMTQDRAPALG